MIQSTIKTRVVGIDISIEQTVYAIVDMRGNIVAKADFPTSDYSSVNDFVTYISDNVIQFLEDNGGYETIRSVGVSAPSGNFLTGCIEHSPNLPWKGKIPLAAMLRDRLGLAVALGNDAHVRALGEHVYGSAHGMKDFIVVNLGHGVGSCIFCNGQAYLGAEGFAGEIGHSCVEHDGRLCGCGNRGCLEAYVGAKGIVRTAMEMMEKEGRQSAMKDEPKLTPRIVFDYCEKGDEVAIEVFRRSGDMLGVALANYASVFNPEAIILAGGVAHAGKWIIDPAIESFESHVFHNVRGKVKILASTLNEVERDVLGAAALAWDVKEYSLFV